MYTLRENSEGLVQSEVRSLECRFKAQNSSQKQNQLLKNNWPPIKDIDNVTNTFDHQVYTNKKL